MESSSSMLYFEEPSPDEVRVQLFAIMLGDQILCTTAAQKGWKAKKKAQKTQSGCGMPTSKAKGEYSELTPSVMERAKEDPLLRFALWPDWLNEHGTAAMREIVEYAFETSPKMEKYMKDAYNTLLQTKDHLFMMAAIFMYASWLCDFDAQTNCVVSHKTLKENSFLATKLLLDKQTITQLCGACYAFERGMDHMTAFSSFVAKFITNHFKRVM
ncbi:MAG: hypothetical protein CMF51_02310 [Legionellales bacterium]|nr:hypothetical protein [Legionellales bacterium]